MWNLSVVLDLLIVMSNVCLKTKDVGSFQDFMSRSEISQLVDQAKVHKDHEIALKWFIFQVHSYLIDME